MIMGKNNGNSWFNAVKKAFRSPVNEDEKRSSRKREENEQEDEEKKRGNKRWIFRKNFPTETTIEHNVAPKNGNNKIRDGNNLVAKDKSEQRCTIAVAMATEQAAVEMIRLTRPPPPPPPLLAEEHKAALVIQTIFRGYLARRALLALKGVVKLQALIRGHNVRKRAKMTLQCIQSLVRVQAQVCDQRRRLSCEAKSLSSFLGHAKNRRNSISGNWSNTSNNLDSDSLSLEEIQALIEKAKECSLKQGKTLAHALSHQVWTPDKDRFSNEDYEELEEEHRSCSSKKTIHSWDRKDINLCYQRDLEIDTSRPYSFTPPNYSHKSRHEKYLDSYSIPSPIHKKYQNPPLHSPKTPSSSKIRPVQAHSCSPCCQTEGQTTEKRNANSSYLHKMSMREKYSCSSPQPNYMGPTASAMARVRSHSTPRHMRGSSPSRVPTSPAKKRLLFDNELRENVPYYCTD